MDATALLPSAALAEEIEVEMTTSTVALLILWSFAGIWQDSPETTPPKQQAHQ
jgi:hypothetical protein